MEEKKDHTQSGKPLVNEPTLESTVDAPPPLQTVTNDEIIPALKTIIDPELYLDIWTLGLIYGIGIEEEGKVHILMTFTSPACPAGPYLLEEVKQKVKGVAGVSDVTVEITFSPPWEASDELRELLGLN